MKNKPYVYNDDAAKVSDDSFNATLNKKNFKELKAKWDKKLLDSGFQDKEYADGELKQPSVRTIAFQNRDKIQDFFLKLDSYLEEHKDIKPVYRRILEAYSQGKFLKEIAKLVKRSKTTVKNVIRKYKKLVLAE